MDRRLFIKQTAAAGTLISLSGTQMGFITSSKKKITILHTNDMHSHIDPFPTNDPKYPNQGGMAKRAALIQKLRHENPNTLLLDAGDVFQGTPYFNFYGGELEFKLMSMMGYDAMTLGNHDFDNGISGLLAQLPHAKFDILTANYDFTNTDLNGYTKPYKIFNKDGVKIGVFGIGIALEGLVNKRLYKETKCLDPIEIAQETASKLKLHENCDLIICLSHLGFEYRDDSIISDRTLATRTSNIDLIIGGHTHTFLNKPVLSQNKDGDFVLINQVGWGGIQLGQIDFYLDDAKNVGTKATYFDL